MAAKKKKKKKRDLDLSNRVLEYGDLTAPEKRDAVSMVSSLSENMPAEMAKKAEYHLKSDRANMRSKGKRYDEATPKMEAKPITMESMVSARKQAFYDVASGPYRRDDESIGGQEFYFNSRRGIDATIGNTSFGIPTLVDATGRLSIQTKPESEKAALSALTHAHTHGTVSFSPQMVDALKGANANVPTEMHGKTVPFSQLPGNVVHKLTDPAIRDVVQAHAPNVNVGNLAKTSMRNNLQYAHEALQGERVVSPTGNPKLYAYGKGHEIAIPDSSEHIEYQLRAGHIGRVARGEESNRQMMFDFEGLRSSNEGVLSNQLQTPNDSWMLANQYQQPLDVRKVAGDVNLSAKKGATKRGRKLSVGEGIKDITPAGIQHAVGNEATTRAASDIQQELGLDFTVPSMLVQEGVWASERRRTGSDSEFNAYQKAQNPKAPRAPKSKDRELPGFKGF